MFAKSLGKLKEWKSSPLHITIHYCCRDPGQETIVTDITVIDTESLILMKLVTGLGDSQPLFAVTAE